jgi:hypothetical protein
MRRNKFKKKISKLETKIKQLTENNIYYCRLYFMQEKHLANLEHTNICMEKEIDEHKRNVMELLNNTVQPIKIEGSIQDFYPMHETIKD